MGSAAMVHARKFAATVVVPEIERVYAAVVAEAK